MKRMNHYVSFRLLKGLGIALLASLMGIFIFSIILMYTNLSEATIPIVIIVISFISILLGATISTRKISQRGMLSGGIIGGTYVALLYLTSSIVGPGFTMNMYTVIMLIAGVIAGLIGGILGVNS